MSAAAEGENASERQRMVAESSAAAAATGATSFPALLLFCSFLLQLQCLNAMAHTATDERRVMGWIQPRTTIQR